MLAKNNGNVDAKIGESALLSVDIALNQQSDIRYQLVPLKDVKEHKVGQEMVLDKTGEFQLMLIDNDRTCSLLDKLEISCAAGYACIHANALQAHAHAHACTCTRMHMHTHAHAQVRMHIQLQR